MAMQRHTNGNGKESFSSSPQHEKQCIAGQKGALRVKKAEFGIRMPRLEYELYH